MSEANWRKKTTSLAHRPRARYSASQGLRAMPAVSADEWTTKGALTVPIWIVYAECEWPSGWHACEESAAARRVTPIWNADGLVEKVGPRLGQLFRYLSKWICLERSDRVGAELRVQRWITSFLISWRMGSKNTRVPLIRMNLVRQVSHQLVGRRNWLWRV